MRRASDTARIRQVRSDRDLNVPDWAEMFKGKGSYREYDESAFSIRDMMAGMGVTKAEAQKLVNERLAAGEIEGGIWKHAPDSTGRLQPSPAYRPVQPAKSEGGKK